MLLRRLVPLAVALVLPASPAAAWTRPGHMVTAAIAYDEIQRTNPQILPALAALLDAHPDKGPFEVAIDRTTGAERARRQFLECARWPDDARRTPFDHPSWHATLTPVVGADADQAARANAAAHPGPAGEALEALALSVRTLGNPRAPAAERAVALCWVLHLTGDIHQPLHTAELFSAAYPQGDGGGSREYVKDPISGEASVLHWLWDDSVHRSGVAASVDALARQIEARQPRATLKELSPPARPDAFADWAKESYALAVSTAYGAGPDAAPSAEAAKPPSPAYWNAVRQTAERRVALAGYRMADLMAFVLAPRAP